MSIKQLKNEIISFEQKNLKNILNEIDKRIIKYSKRMRTARLEGGTPGPAFYQAKIKKYEKLKKDLYFGKMELEIDDEYKEYYIGRVGMEDSEDELIIDWRTPVGGLFYQFHGNDGYRKLRNDDNDDAIIYIKREIEIKNNKVINCMDTYSNQYLANKNRQTDKLQLMEDSTKNENNRLKSQLEEASSKEGLHDIIMTIQPKQDEVIRKPINNPVVIQGVAGSGKTTIAFHRISYLLYEYENQLRPENILVIAPNNVYLSYVENVLPGLQINDIQQETYLSFTKQIVPEIAHITAYDSLASILATHINGDRNIRFSEGMNQFKGSMQFKEMIDQYFNQYQLEIESMMDAHTLNHPLSHVPHTYTKEQVLNRLADLSYLPIEERYKQTMQSVKNWHDDKLKEFIEELNEKKDEFIYQWAYEFVEDSKERKDIVELTLLAYEKKKHKFLRYAEKAWRTFSQSFKVLSPVTLYKDMLFNEGSILYELIESDLLRELQDSYNINNNCVSALDLPILLYFKYKLEGIETDIKHIVIDEAQDLSPFHFYVLSLITKSMTILGDMTQSIYSFAGINDWKQLNNDVFVDRNISFTEINVSYRSTKNIVDIANTIIENAQLDVTKVEPYPRSNDLVKVQRIYDAEDLLVRIKESIETFFIKDCKRIAIIYKDRNRSANLYDQLSRGAYEGRVQFISEPNSKIEKEIVIIPSYLVKGIDFDAVIIPNANGAPNNFTHTELDAKLLYVSTTRALHGLHIYYHESISPLLFNNEYEVESSRKVNNLGIL